MIRLSIMVPVYNQEELVIRALDSIPKRLDVELLIIDDFSTDNTYKVIEKWVHDFSKYFGNVILKRNDKNEGCGYGKNWAYKNAEGEYITTLDSDDYYYTDEFNKAIDCIDGKDVIRLKYKTNDGAISTGRVATWGYFMKKSFMILNNIEYDKSARRAGDWFMYMNQVSQIEHTECILDLCAYHYNYPREGSIVWNWEHFKKV